MRAVARAAGRDRSTRGAELGMCGPEQVPAAAEARRVLRALAKLEEDGIRVRQCARQLRLWSQLRVAAACSVVPHSS
jgi:hypothetical protein